MAPAKGLTTIMNNVQIEMGCMVALHTAINMAEDTADPDKLKIFLVEKMMDMGWEDAIVHVVYNQHKAAMDAADAMEKMKSES